MVILKANSFLDGHKSNTDELLKLLHNVFLRFILAVAANMS
jgi:hypothetical protein